MPVTINGSDGITNASWTTGTRPSNPVAGQIGYNTDLGFTEVYDGNNDEWQPLNPFSQQVVTAVSEATDINEAASFVGQGAIVDVIVNDDGTAIRWESGVQTCFSGRYNNSRMDDGEDRVYDLPAPFNVNETDEFYVNITGRLSNGASGQHWFATRNIDSNSQVWVYYNGTWGGSNAHPNIQVWGFWK